MQQQFRTNHDDGTAGVIDTLAKQVLTEAALLALQHIAERFQRPFVSTRDHAPASAIVEQRVNGFLQHTLFVPHDNVRRAQFHQPLQAVVPVNDTAIKVVQIGRSEPAAVQRHQRTQLRRDDRDHLKDHPLRTRARLNEGFDQLQALDQFLPLGFGIGLLKIDPNLIALGLEVDAHQHVLQGFGTDFRGERIRTEFVLRVIELVVRQQLTHAQRRQARLDDHIVFEVEDALQLFQGHVKQQTNSAWQRLQEPNMRDRGRQLDVPHALAPDLRQGDFNPTLLANDSAILHPLILTAQAFVILNRAENTRTE